MEYFLFYRLISILWGVQGVSVIKIYSYEQILLLEELISTYLQNDAQMFKKIISVFFSIRLW